MSTRWLRAPLFLPLIALVAATMACGSGDNNAAECSADQACSDATKTFCDIDGVSDSSELANECIEPPYAGACNRVETCPEGDTPHCNDDSLGTCVACLEPSHCATGQACTEEGACIDFTCEPGDAGDAACADLNSDAPFCSPNEACVVCLGNEDCSDVAASVCDLTDFTCRGCQLGSECDSGVCQESTGECVAESDVVYVATTGTDGGDCTLAAPCKTINGGLVQVDATRNYLQVAAGNYGDPVVIAKDVTIVGDEGTVIAPTLVGSSAAVFVSGNISVALEGIRISPAASGASAVLVACEQGASEVAPSLTIEHSEISGCAGLGIDSTGCNLTIRSQSTVSGNQGIGVSVDGGSLEMSQSTVSGNQGIGVSVDGGSLEMSQSTVSGNQGGGISVNAASFEIVNNFIVNNVSNGLVGGARFETTGELNTVLALNTFFGNQNGADGGAAISCAISDLVAENNIFMNRTGISFGLVDDCDVRFSLFDAEAANNPPADNGNILANASFVDSGDGDFHLTAGSPGIDAADPASTVTIDFDGEPRPAPGSAGPDMGADEVQ